MKVRCKKIVTAGFVLLLTSCSHIFYPKTNALESIQQGMSPQEVTQLLGKPDYRRFDHDLEEWEYRKLLSALESEPTIVIVRFEDGKLVYMDSFKESERSPTPRPHNH